MSNIMNIVNSKKDNSKTKTFPILPAGNALTLNSHYYYQSIITIITFIR